MSFILPATYKQIADNLGQAYALIRDAINDGTVGSNSYNLLQTSLDLVVDEDDSEVLVAIATDPAGSISNDLGSTWFRTANTDFSESQAKKIAANLFSSALRRLNSHSFQRTGVSNIASYYSTYAYASNSNADYNLFTDKTTNNSSYFTAEFAELSSQLNITIDSQYVYTP